MEVDSDEPHDCAPWVETNRVEETTSQPLRFTTFFKAHRAAGSTSFLPIVSNACLANLTCHIARQAAQPCPRIATPNVLLVSLSPCLLVSLPAICYPVI